MLVEGPPTKARLSDLPELAREVEKLGAKTVPHALVVRYEAAEVIAREGEYGDWAVLPLEGAVREYQPGVSTDARPGGGRPANPSREEGLDLPRPLGRVRDPHAGHTEIGAAAALPARLVGVTAPLWNQPRAATLAAGPDGCTALMVKRAGLAALFRTDPRLCPWNRAAFWADELPRWLRGNRLFSTTPPPADAIRDALAGAELLRFDRASGTRHSTTARTADLPTGEKPEPGTASRLLFDQGNAASRTLDLVLTGSIRLSRKGLGAR